MEGKEIDQLTLGEKIGRTMQASESTKEMLEKYIVSNNERMCKNEEIQKAHGEKIANLSGRAIGFGSIGGLLATAVTLLIQYFNGK
jgi:hypothetical protein